MTHLISPLRSCAKGRDRVQPWALCMVLLVCVSSNTLFAQEDPAAEPTPVKSTERAAPLVPAADTTKSADDDTSAVPSSDETRGAESTTVPAATVESGGDDATPTKTAAEPTAATADGATADGATAGGATAGGATAKSGVPALVEASVDELRTPVDRLTEHYLGTTSRPVRFDWRNSLFILGVHGGELIERNNFGSFRLGALVRRSFLSLMFEAGASYVFVVGTESSELLALTPYRQASRPPRIELDVNVSYPLFEGVVTPLFDFIPASEMVLSVTGGGRYLVYPQTIIGDRDWDRTSTWTDTQTWQDIGTGLATAQLLDDDRRLLERRGLPGMQIDPATVHTLAGFTFDAYYQPGLFFSARALLAIPALYLVSGTRLGFWWETTLVAGWAF